MRAEQILGGLERAGKMAEDTVLVLILSVMILLAAGQIVLRNFFDIGFIWNDELLRLLVLWVAVAGAVAASRDDRHITVDVLRRFLPERSGLVAMVVTRLFTSGISGLVAWHGLQFVMTSHEFGDLLLGKAPAWIFQAVLPVGFGLIAWRYAVLSVKAVLDLTSRGDQA